MRALLERSKAARVAVVLAAAALIVSLVNAAEAGDDFGLRRAMLLPDGLLSALGLAAPAPAQAAEREPTLVAAPRPHRDHGRRIWAAARGRPLRIALERPSRLARAMEAPVWAASLRVHPTASSQLYRLVPPPNRPPLISIYNDRTLRSGDAVMLDDGIHVFRDDGFWPHRPRDFVRLQSVAGLDWRLRRTLEPFDNNPPTRWTSIMVPPA